MRRLVLLTLLLTSIGSSALSAHSTATVTTPANGAVLTAPPAHFTLMFNEAAKLVQMTLQRAGDAKPLAVGPLPTQAGQHFQIKAPAMAPGKYTLRYRTISLDGHAAPGIVKFTVQGPAR